MILALLSVFSIRVPGTSLEEDTYSSEQERNPWRGTVHCLVAEKVEVWQTWFLRCQSARTWEFEDGTGSSGNGLRRSGQ